MIALNGDVSSIGKLFKLLKGIDDGYYFFLYLRKVCLSFCESATSVHHRLLILEEGRA